MFKNVLSVVAMFVLVLGTNFAKGTDQIEKEAASQTARGVLVKIDEKARVMEVYRVNEMSAGMSESSHPAEKAAAIAAVARPENKVLAFSLAENELDKDSSTGAWYWGGWNNWNWYNPWYNTGYFGYNNYAFNYGWGWNNWNNCNWGWYW